MRENEALEFLKNLDYFVGRKVYSINGGDFTIHDFYADLQNGSDSQFDIFVNLIPQLSTAEGQFKRETFGLFKSTYAISDVIGIKVDVIEDVRRLCLFVSGGI